jgi:peptidoglycan/LPS O-acetylase OafA/YrhL
MTLRASFAASPRLADILTPETNSFGVLRFVMATLVLISHSYLYAAGTSEAEPLQPWLGRSLGECAVQVFFILSGVMVAQSFDRSRSIIDFTVARVLRIFPALIVSV